MKNVYQAPVAEVCEAEVRNEILESSYIEPNPNPGGFDTKKETGWDIEWETATEKAE